MNFFKDILDFILPPHCAICKKPLKRQENLVCEKCINGIELTYPRKEIDSLRVKSLATGDRILELIHLFKYRAKISIGKRLGQMMSAVFENDKVLKQTDVIIPVPLYRTRQRQRGFNQSEILASAMSKELGKTAIIEEPGKIGVSPVSIYKNALIRTRNTKSQTSFTAKDLSRSDKIRLRKLNVKNAFWVRRPELVKGKKIALIDDVFTTGATLQECAKTLLNAGADTVSAITCMSA